MYAPNLNVTSFDGGNPFDCILDNSGPDGQVLYEGTAYPGTSTSAGVRSQGTALGYSIATNNVNVPSFAKG